MSIGEGNLEAPTRHPLDWKNSAFYNEEKLNHELERVLTPAMDVAAVYPYAPRFRRCSIWWTGLRRWRWMVSPRPIS